jgi:pimeloyl-ACP methyl ester carboxylesterase
LVFAAALVIAPGEGGPSILGQPINVGLLATFAPFRRWGQILLRSFFGPAHVTATLKTAYFNPAFATPDVIAGALRPQTVRDWDLALLGIVRDSGRNALPQPVSAIAAPVLLVWGEQDTWVPLARGQQLRAALPQAQWVLIARAGHLAMEEQAAAFNTALIDFLGPAAGTSMAPQPTGSITRALPWRIR